MTQERQQQLREKAVTIFELTKGFTPEQRQYFDNAFHAMEEMAGYVLELTATPDAQTADKWLLNVLMDLHNSNYILNKAAEDITNLVLIETIEGQIRCNNDSIEVIRSASIKDVSKPTPPVAQTGLSARDWVSVSNNQYTLEPSQLNLPGHSRLVFIRYNKRLEMEVGDKRHIIDLYENGWSDIEWYNESAPPDAVDKSNASVVPRRLRLDLNEPAELAIRNAADEIEKLPPDIRLTNALNLLWEAKELVSDFIDKIEFDPHRLINEKDLIIAGLEEGCEEWMQKCSDLQQDLSALQSPDAVEEKIDNGTPLQHEALKWSNNLYKHIYYHGQGCNEAAYYGYIAGHDAASHSSGAGESVVNEYEQLNLWGKVVDMLVNYKTGKYKDFADTVVKKFIIKER